MGDVLRPRRVILWHTFQLKLLLLPLLVDLVQSAGRLICRHVGDKGSHNPQLSGVNHNFVSLYSVISKDFFLENCCKFFLCFTHMWYIVSYDVMENHVIYGWNLKRSCHSDTAQTQAWNLVFFWPTNPNATSSLLAEKFLIEVQLLLQSIHTYYFGKNNLS